MWLAYPKQRQIPLNAPGLIFIYPHKISGDFEKDDAPRNNDALSPNGKNERASSMNSLFYDGSVTEPTIQQWCSEAHSCHFLVAAVNRLNALKRVMS